MTAHNPLQLLGFAAAVVSMDVVVVIVCASSQDIEHDDDEISSRDERHRAEELDTVRPNVENSMRFMYAVKIQS